MHCFKCGGGLCEPAPAVARHDHIGWQSTLEAALESGWAPLGAGDDQTHPELIALVGLAMVVVVPFVWGLIRRAEGLPTFGSPTVSELEGDRAAAGSDSAVRDDQAQVR